MYIYNTPIKKGGILTKIFTYYININFRSINDRSVFSFSSISFFTFFGIFFGKRALTLLIFYSMEIINLSNNKKSFLLCSKSISMHFLSTQILDQFLLFNLVFCFLSNEITWSSIIIVFCHVKN